MIDNNAVLHWEEKMKPSVFERVFKNVLRTASDIQYVQWGMYGYALSIGYKKPFTYFADARKWSDLCARWRIDEARALFATILRR